MMHLLTTLSNYWGTTSVVIPSEQEYLHSCIARIDNSGSSELTFYAIFEFICAQAPRTTQGLLIGLLCHLQHQVPSSRNTRQCHHWEEVLADLWGSEVVSDPGVSGPVLICVQTLPLPTARLDSQCAGNDWGHSWEVVRPGGGVYALNVEQC